ncbi:DUF924 family protein [Pararhodobacter zhoushanensis]|uniref:DUF924 domain-containing protein n=1 Tax=Pararhodobacter zhoushanensis TaxID=2479545 RepID=A0ABT3H0H1_9RHOB|nr:DUF924 family protein [Pararhodobacter zhoushanensis]MCW1933311.1 DUF924 domain-containing protein [Pararhodobacter zhoushanensis]
MTTSPRADAILQYWNDLGPEGWYAGGEALDAEIRDQFEGDWDKADAGALIEWMSCPEGILAYLLLTDQFPRNMFRGKAKAFATDKRARRVAHYAWQNKADLRIDEPVRQFFYLPLMHSESSFDQDRAVALMISRLPETGASNVLHACAHRDIIRKFRRFPFRNEALSRESSPDEIAFLENGGYGEIVRSLGG